MIRAHISLDPVTYERAELEASRRGITVAEYVRRCQRRELVAAREVEQPWMRYVGTLEGHDPEASATIDATVYGRNRP